MGRGRDSAQTVCRIDMSLEQGPWEMLMHMIRIEYQHCRHDRWQMELLDPPGLYLWVLTQPACMMTARPAVACHHHMLDYTHQSCNR
jgi:hypothetical protein